jgi:2-methylaconitate cis-trans-isomerase PrpF
MTQSSFPTVFMRGGTSRALFFHTRDLPARAPGEGYESWSEIFLAALGSPDPNGRQLDGMGGGISSLSKIAVIGPPTRDDADVDYTFAQVAIGQAVVGYRGNCGNISSAVGPFAVEEGLVKVPDGRAEIRIHNTNTGKIIIARFDVQDGQAVIDGDFLLTGVAGTAAPIELAFTELGGAATGRLLPTGHVRDTIDVAGLGPVEVSLVDAANPTVFATPAALGLTGIESPDAFTQAQIEMLEELRVSAAVAMGLVTQAEEARTTLRNLPLVGIVSPARDSTTLSGAKLTAADADLTVRMISAGQPHRATPLTGAMCTSIAARIPGTLVQQALAADMDPGADLRIAHPSGTLTVAAKVRPDGDSVFAEEAVVYRTARRLMEGRVLVRSRLLGRAMK